MRVRIGFRALSPPRFVHDVGERRLRGLDRSQAGRVGVGVGVAGGRWEKHLS